MNVSVTSAGLTLRLSNMAGDTGKSSNGSSDIYLNGVLFTIDATSCNSVSNSSMDKLHRLFLRRRFFSPKQICKLLHGVSRLADCELELNYSELKCR